MERFPDKPSGSVIEEREELDGVKLFWRLPSGGPGRFAGAAFIAFWLCAWAFAWVMSANQLAHGRANIFLVGWLGAWTVGGGVAMWTLWRLVQPTRPESVTLSEDVLVHDPGSSSVDAVHRYGIRPYQRSWPQGGWGPPPTRNRKRVAVLKDDLGKFVLDRVGERQRLSFDRGADRIEIGESLREPEREWLWRVLEGWRQG